MDKLIQRFKELFLLKYHGFTKEQWDNELIKTFPYSEMPMLQKMCAEECKEIAINFAEEVIYRVNKSDALSKPFTLEELFNEFIDKPWQPLK